MKNLNYFSEKEVRALSLDELIEADKEFYPRAFDYMKNELGVESEKDLVILKVHPDKVKRDEEGWDLDAYFPKNEKPEIMEERDDFEPHVIVANYHGIRLVGMQDASPIMFYANKRDIAK